MRERDDNTTAHTPGALSRRDLLRTGTALGAAGVLSAGVAEHAAAELLQADKKTPMPMATLGKTRYESLPPGPRAAPGKSTRRC